MPVALGIQHAMRMRHTVLCGPVRLYSIFPHYKRHDFRKKFTEHKMCDLILSTNLKHFSFYDEMGEYGHECILVFI